MLPVPSLWPGCPNAGTAPRHPILRPDDLEQPAPRICQADSDPPPTSHSRRWPEGYLSRAPGAGAAHLLQSAPVRAEESRRRRWGRESGSPVDRDSFVLPRRPARPAPYRIPAEPAESRTVSVSQQSSIPQRSFTTIERVPKMKVVHAQQLFPQSGFNGRDQLPGARQKSTVWPIERPAHGSSPGLKPAGEVHNTRVLPVSRFRLPIGPAGQAAQQIPAAVQRQPIVPQDGIERFLM